MSAATSAKDMVRVLEQALPLTAPEDRPAGGAILRTLRKVASAARLVASSPHVEHVPEDDLRAIEESVSSAAPVIDQIRAAVKFHGGPT